MGEVISITGKKFFTLEEANTLLPTIISITKKYENKIEKLLSDQRFYMRTGAPKHVVDSADMKVVQLMNEWGAKITKLGGVVLGSRVVSFDSGFGYYNWAFGEPKVMFFYDYGQGVHERREMGIIFK